MGLLEAKFDPWPQLSFEYANGGSLDMHPATSTLDEVRYMCQLLSALVAMHTRTPPIVHRDIKPENILRFVSPDGSIRVKFTDFGLGKNTDQLKTFCGTLRYAAPEIYSKMAERHAKQYTVAVDIWSLAVVFAERASGLPKYYKSYGTSTTAWNKAVLEYVMNQPEEGSELIPFLLENMLYIEPHMRKPACYCHDQALQLFDRLSRQQTPPGAEVTDSHRSLIAELGYRGSSKIDSLVNSDDDNDPDDESTFRRLDSPHPDTQQPRAANQYVATMVEGERWVDEQIERPSPDGILPRVGARDSQNGAVLKGLDVSTRIRRYIGGALFHDVNQGTRVLEEDDLERTFGPTPKRARLGDSSSALLGNSSSMGLVQLTE